jgi:hypothetical protein
MWGDANWGDHTAINPMAARQFRGDFMGIFRKPSARVHSAWNHFAKEEQPGSYAAKTQGGITKMLAGQEYGLDCIWDKWPCQGEWFKWGYVLPNTATALHNLEGFKFVGLQEHYDLTICLFHAMFGGECLPVEFANMRPGTYTNATTANPFEMWPDPFDEAIYAKVKDMFWKNIRAFNVKRSTCAKTCNGAHVKGYFSLARDRDVKSCKGSCNYDYDWPGRYSYNDDE